MLKFQVGKKRKTSRDASVPLPSIFSAECDSSDDSEESSGHEKAQLAQLRQSAVAAAEKGQYTVAKTRFELYVREARDDAAAFDMLAQVCLEVDEVFAAVKAAEQSVSICPDQPKWLQTLGRAQLNLGEVEMAVASFEKALAIVRQSHEKSTLAEEGRVERGEDGSNDALDEGDLLGDLKEATVLLDRLKKAGVGESGGRKGGQRVRTVGKTDDAEIRKVQAEYEAEAN
uniref:Tetratricopeptide SHNi-TPR domain-containing protein n=1 Tax=Palpitomonas bilix TaxID=652834 RepID=A0A7S3GM14_9EUKA|mmetsp:Transcript_9022/g.24536  ORF Transcript_9022/g.24536 Transcript_9022/m.24536 type:complete len:229 (+) Transcript_9022:165-851(+)